MTKLIIIDRPIGYEHPDIAKRIANSLGAELIQHYPQKQYPGGIFNPYLELSYQPDVLIPSDNSEEEDHEKAIQAYVMLQKLARYWDWIKESKDAMPTSTPTLRRVIVIDRILDPKVVFWLSKHMLSIQHNVSFTCDIPSLNEGFSRAADIYIYLNDPLRTHTQPSMIGLYDAIMEQVGTLDRCPFPKISDIQAYLDIEPSYPVWTPAELGILRETLPRNGFHNLSTWAALSGRYRTEGEICDQIETLIQKDITSQLKPRHDLYHLAREWTSDSEATCCDTSDKEKKDENHCD